MRALPSMFLHKCCTGVHNLSAAIVLTHFVIFVVMIERLCIIFQIYSVPSSLHAMIVHHHKEYIYIYISTVVD